jgi:hypothetical protein
VGIEDRLGYVHETPRTLAEVAPPRLRALVSDELVAEQGALHAYQTLCERANQAPDPNVWGPEWAGERIPGLIAALPWLEVYKLVEELALTRSRPRRPWSDKPNDFEGRVNAVLASCGVAYELVDGEIAPFNAPVPGLELSELAAPNRDARFQPAFEQYARARLALEKVPEDLFAAVREAANAVEAIAKILSGRKSDTLHGALDFLYGKGTPEYQRALLKSIREAYNYASQVPGARHGQHETVVLSRAEVMYIVRTCGAAMEYLIRDRS